MPLMTTFVNFANVSATVDGLIRLEFGEVVQQGHAPPPSVAIALPRGRAEEIANLMLQLLAKSAAQQPALQPKQ